LKLSEGEALEFARGAAEAFGVGSVWTAKFDKKSVTEAAKADDKKKEEKKAKK
jgi:hypothetical protein